MFGRGFMTQEIKQKCIPSHVRQGRLGGRFVDFKQVRRQMNAIGRIRMTMFTQAGIHMQEIATGFLIDLKLGFDVIITNNHVIADKKEAIRCDFICDDRNLEFEMYPEKLFITHVQYDFTVCAVLLKCDRKARPATEREISPIPIPDQIPLLSADSIVKVVGHPLLHDLQESIDKVDRIEDYTYMWYKCDTERGSSGSPVFFEGKLAGIHSTGSANANKGTLLFPILTELSKYIRVPNFGESNTAEMTCFGQTNVFGAPHGIAYFMGANKFGLGEFKDGILDGYAVVNEAREIHGQCGIKGLKYEGHWRGGRQHGYVLVQEEEDTTLEVFSDGKRITHKVQEAGIRIRQNSNWMEHFIRPVDMCIDF